MVVDNRLIDAARQLLAERFSDRGGAACAAYSTAGTLYTGISLIGSSGAASVDPETGPICEAARDGELITALVTVRWDGPGSDVIFQTPSGLSLDRLVQYGLRDAQIVVHDFFDKANVMVKPLRDLVPHHISDSGIDQNFRMGMRRIATSLTDLAVKYGRPKAHDEFGPLLLDCLEDPVLRATAAERSFRGAESDFILPVHLESVALRHAWVAFDTATPLFINKFVDEHADELRDLGANESDVFHVKQGGEAFRNVFGNLLVFVETREPMRNELPFQPYHAALLKHGVPMHEYLELQSFDLEGHAGAEDAERVLTLIDVLANEDEGGFVAYLKQRRLFMLDVFRGQGPGYCPFRPLAHQMLAETARALAVGLQDGLILTGGVPDRPDV